MRSVEATSGLTVSAQAQRIKLCGLHLQLTATRSITMERFQLQTTNLGLALLYGTVMERLLLHLYRSWTRLTSPWKLRQWQLVRLWSLAMSWVFIEP